MVIICGMKGFDCGFLRIWRKGFVVLGFRVLRKRCRLFGFRGFEAGLGVLVEFRNGNKFFLELVVIVRLKSCGWGF